MTTLNPALQEARFCPRCAQPATIAYPRSITCPHCGYGAYYNPKPVAAAIPGHAQPTRSSCCAARSSPARTCGRSPAASSTSARRSSKPPAARRREELDIAIELGALVGVYSRAEERTVLIVYAARATEPPRTTEEALEVRSFDRDDIPWDELAFWSTRDALRDFLTAAH